MNLEQLKAALAAGTITLEQFKAQAKAWLASQLTTQAMDQAAHDTALAEVEATTEGGGAGGGGGGGGGGGMTAEQIAAEIAKAVQAAEDRLRTAHTKKSKEQEDELERLKREKMTEEERAKDDLAKAQKDLAEQKAELERQRVELHTISTLAKHEISPDFKEFLVAGTIEDTDKRIEAFKGTWAKALKDEVEKRFKTGGTDPNGGKGGGGGGAVNPWIPGPTYNLTKQAEILRTNPELAKQYKAAAGAK